MTSIGNGILNSLGGNNGIDTGNLVEQLVEIERAPKQESIDGKRSEMETQLSDFGVLRSALATLQDSASTLIDSETFFAKNASFTNSTALTPTELGSEAPEGDYAFTVGAIASAQSLSSATFDDTAAAVGKGTLTFSFGNWDGAGNFTGNGTRADQTLTIDDSNNSLSGVRDAINNADFGVQATIINTGSGYRLALTAPSGADNELRISVAEEGDSPSNTDATGLSRFSFTDDQGAGQMSLDQTGADAQITINGLSVTRSSNTIDDVVEGFSFDISKPTDVGEVININISADKAGGEQAIRDFIETYNAFREVADRLTGFNQEDEEAGIEEGYGSLHRDATASSIVRDLRTLLSNSVAGVTGAFDALAQVGVRTERDGSLSIDEDTLSAALQDNYSAVQQLFAPSYSSSSDGVVVTDARNSAKSGSYDVVISQAPEQGAWTGSAASVSGTLLADLAQPQSGTLTGANSDSDLLANLAAAGAGDYDFSLSVDGTASATISLAPGNYADHDALASHIQAQINADANLSAAGRSVVVSHNGSGFVIASASTGSSSAVTDFTDLGASTSELGLASGEAVSGAQQRDFGFQVSVDGNASATVYPSAKAYASFDELAAELETRINADNTLLGAGAAVTVSWETDHFVVSSRAYGSSSQVSMTAVGSRFADFGLDQVADAGVSASQGKDVAGTIDGVTAFGVGNVLLPALNTDAYGIKLQVKAGATGASIDFSRGFGGELETRIQEFIAAAGVIDARETSLSSDIDGLEDDQDRLDRRIEAYQARLERQFLNMQAIISGLTQSGDMLEGLADRLPFTSQTG